MEARVDKPIMTQGAADRLIASERAIERAFADAAFAMFGFGQPRQGVQTLALSGAPLVLSEVRRALVEARRDG
jgi:hypothetical protein